MNALVISHRCAHCVHRQAVLGFDQGNACLRSCIGMACPVCDTRARNDDLEIVALGNFPNGGQGEDLQIIVLDEHGNAVEGDGLRLEDPNYLATGFETFGNTALVPTFERGKFAETLRERMIGQAEKRRKTEYLAISTVIAEILGVSFGIRAYEDGDLTRAMLWLKRAVRVLDEPNPLAGAYLYIGLIGVDQGQPNVAKTAFRDAIACTDADPTIRCAAAEQLGSVLKELGDVAGARRTYRSAIDVSNSMFASKAAVNLGMLEAETGNEEVARSLWEIAYKSTHGAYRTFAAHNLGLYWEHVGDPAKARKFFEFAAQSSDSEVATRAARRLRALPAPSRRRLFRRRRKEGPPT